MVNGVTLLGLVLVGPWLALLMMQLQPCDLGDLTHITVPDLCPAADSDGTHETTCTDCGADLDRCCVHCPTERTTTDG